ncbi:glycosyltransferase family 2 protein [Pontibacter kalidii]|uniref:glycosyltransferase family 2 protein n=1 Tax=Pontibacter kalidii TaxID=2592049 RepID=UPI002256FED9|nr:glycosyltransferase family A protein [Pontibacter kalidii]
MTDLYPTQVEDKPLVTIVTPAFNRGDIITATIESIQRQSYKNWELLIVDDGSTDNTEEVINHIRKKDERIIFFKRPSHHKKGANSCRNFGIQNAKGEFIKWVDSDDLLDPDALQKQIDTFKDNPGLNVCFSHGRFFNNETFELEERWSRKLSSDDPLWDHIRNELMWPIGGPLWRKKFVENLPFDIDLKNSQEWLMHGIQTLRLKNDEYIILKDILYLIRRGNIRMSSSKSSEYYFNQAKARVKLLSHIDINFQNRKYIKELIKQYLIYSLHGWKNRF